MKARLLLSFCLTAYTFALLAQTQQGYVKTLGRPNQPGQMLQGVSIRVQGVHNAMVSAADGSFAFTLQGHKEGDAYRLNSVRKQGYELNEPDAVGRRYALSGRVRLAIVMVSTQQLEADRQRIETNAYKAAERNYKQQMTELKQQLKSQTLTTEQYREAIARLQERFECYQGLIDNMAEHYARTDYDSLDAVSRQINLFIENGRLEEADSMLRLSFNPLDVLKNNRQALSRIRQAEKQAHDVMSQAQADLQAVLRQQQKDAEYLYHLYTISLARFDNDKARYYIETRAQLDTLNAEWQLDAGEFQDEYLNDFATARTYYDRALAVSQSQQNDLWTARAYNDIGMTDIEARQTEKGISLLEKALQMRRQLLGDDHPLVAIVYNNLGGCMALSGQAHKCLEYYEKALQIRLKAYGEQNENTAKSYSNLGTQHGEMGHYDKAIEYLLKAIETGLATKGEYTRFMASSYDNIGAIYLRMGEVDKALEYNQKALNVRTKLYGLVHEDVAWSYNNLAVTLSSKGGEGNYRQAIDYLSQAIRSYSELRGENNLFIANCQQNQASLNYKRGKYELSAHQFLHSIVVYTKAEDSTYIDIALSYEGLAKVYGMQDKLDKKRDALSKAADVYEANGESYRLKAAKLYSQVASMYGNKGMDEQKTAYTQKVITLLTGYTTEDRQEQAEMNDLLGQALLSTDIDRAIGYMKKTAEIRQELNGDDKLTADSYASLALAYSRKKDRQKAEDYFAKAGAIVERLQGSAADLLTAKYILNYQKGLAYNILGLDSLSFVFHKKALNLNTQIFRSLGVEGDDFTMASDIDALWQAAINMKWYRVALHYAQRLHALYKKVFGPSHQETLQVNDRVALMYSFCGDYDKSLSQYLAGLKKWETILPAGSSLLSVKYYNVALASFYGNKLSEAHNYAVKALEYYEKNNLMDNEDSVYLKGIIEKIDQNK